MVNAHTLKEWSETPRTLAEEMALEAVRTGSVDGDAITWKGATREPFLSLEAQGAVKLQTVVRLSDGNVTVHFWQSTTGERSHCKVMTS